MGLLRGDRRKILEEVSQGMPAVQIIEKRLHKHAGPGKAWRSTHYVGINHDDTRLHSVTLAHRPLPARQIQIFVPTELRAGGMASGCPAKPIQFPRSMKTAMFVDGCFSIRPAYG
jgi:hypothetical protein